MVLKFLQVVLQLHPTYLESVHYYLGLSHQGSLYLFLDFHFDFLVGSEMMKRYRVRTVLVFLFFLVGRQATHSKFQNPKGFQACFKTKRKFHSLPQHVITEYLLWPRHGQLFRQILLQSSRGNKICTWYYYYREESSLPHKGLTSCYRVVGFFFPSSIPMLKSI